jgi:hypothetical protein
MMIRMLSVWDIVTQCSTGTSSDMFNIRPVPEVCDPVVLKYGIVSSLLGM